MLLSLVPGIYICYDLVTQLWFDVSLSSRSKTEYFFLGFRYIYIEDFMRFLTEDESERAMDLFEGASESHKISKSCLKNWVVRVCHKLILETSVLN